MGIGTSSPTQKLDVRGGGYFEGSVGIGTTNPTKAKLEVSGFAATEDYQAYQYTAYLKVGQLVKIRVPPPGVGTPVSETDLPLSIHASQGIAADGYIAFSDARIKEIEGVSKGQEDLNAFLGIEITDYTHIDKVSKGNRRQKKVIAQQVEKVFPQAVSQSTDIVPDIYKLADTENGWITLDTDLKVGDRVRLIEKDKEGIYEVLETRESGFRTAHTPAGDQIFVYGREVDDFRSVDYEAIAMLNVSATQEIYRHVQKQAAALAEKDAQISTLEKRLATLEARDKARDEGLARIESLLEAKPSIVPVTTALR